MEPSLNTSATQSGATGQFRDLLANGSSYANAQVEQIKASAQVSLMGLVSEVLSVFWGGMAFIVAVAFLMYGIAIGLNTVLGGGVWIGFVLTGGGLVLGRVVVKKIAFAQCRKKQQRLTRQTQAAKFAFQKTGELLKQTITDSMDVKKLTQEHPFYSTGAAAIGGFVLASGMTAQNFNEQPQQENEGQQSEGASPATKDASALKLAFATMLATVAEDVLRQAVVPAVKKHLTKSPNTDHGRSA
jgi:hypothetical protein